MNATEIQRIGVIGAGLMGHAIALEFAAAGFGVWLHDRGEAELARARQTIDASLRLWQELGILTASQAATVPARLNLTSDLAAAVGDAEVVIEAVFEDLAIKQALFRQLDALAPPAAILASNTSTFMPSLLAESTERPAQVLVAHYFNPPHLLPLVELVRGPATADATIATMRDLYQRIGKRPVVVQKEAPGFVGNRMQVALLREALSIVEQGIATPEEVDTVIKSGFGRRLSVAGVFEVFDAAGWDVTLAVLDQLLPAISATNEAPVFVREKVAQGDLGIKSGRGFYDWTPEQAAALRARIAQALVAIERLG
jgi:3-hydroxybutyryl-CoA dehydrogenase